jgi:hypothetical protein
MNLNCAHGEADMRCESIESGLVLRNAKLMQIIGLDLGIPMLTLRHRITRSARETQATLPDGCLVQKSVTGKFGDQLVLWTGVSDFRVMRPHTRQVAKALAAQTRRTLANHTLNPPDIEPARFFGMDDGMVSPFLVPGTLALQRLAAIVQLTPPGEWESGMTVAISLSLRVSVMIPGTRLGDLLSAYAHQVHPHIPVIDVPTGLARPAYSPGGFSDRAPACEALNEAW